MDQERVGRALRRIRAILSGDRSGGFEKLGDYLLEEFFEGNPELYESTSLRKHASLKLLMAQCGTAQCPMHQAVLSEALRCAAVCRQLPRGSSFSQLSPTHRSALLVLKTPERIEKFAERARAEALTVKKVRKEVRQEVARKRSTRRRRASPDVIQALRACAVELRNEMNDKLSQARFDQRAAAQIDELRTLASVLEQRAAELEREP